MAEEQAATENSLLRLAQYLESINRATWQAAGDERLSRTIMGQIEKRDKKKADDIEKQRIAAEALADEEKRKKLEAAKQSGFFQKLVDHFSWQRDYTEREAKKENRMMSRIKDFGKTQVDMLKSAAKGLFDLLLTGLGLIALYKLFQWLREQDWEQLYNDVVQFAQEMLDEFNFVIDAFLEVGGLLARMTGLFWAYYLFSKFTSWDEATKALGLFLDKFSFKNLFGPDSKIRQILRSLKTMFFGGTIINAVDDIEVRKGLWGTLFGPDSKIRVLLRRIGSMFGFMLTGVGLDVETRRGIWTTLFGPDSRIRKILRGIQSLFGGATIVEAVDDVDVKRGFISRWFGADSPIRRMLRFIGRIFGGAIKFALNFATAGGFGAMFGEEGAIQKLLGWVKGFFGGEGKLVTAFKAISTNPQIVKVVNFLKTIGAKMLKFLGPVTWLIAGYDAIAGEGGFMDTFNKTEGSLWEKTVAGLSAAVQSLVDFFVFDTVALIEDFVKWSIKKLAGLFGIEEKDVEGADWYKFSIAGFLSEAFGDYLKFLEGVFTLDPEKMAAGIKGLWGKASGIMDWAYQTLLAPIITWAAGMLGFDIDPEAVTEFSPSKFLEDHVINPIIEFFEKLLNIDIGKLFGDALGALGKAGDKLLGFFGFGEDDEKPKETVRKADGGPLKAGQFAIVGEEGPELIRMGKMPGKVIPAQESKNAMSGGAPVIVNAPSTTSNVSSSPTSVVMGVSSTDPNKALLSY